jgi:NADH-quinone oxidoreductase subunit E
VFAYTAERRATLEEICSRYPPEQRKSAILAALYLAQQQQGHLTRNAMRHVAEAIGCTSAEVEEVVTFYTMYHQQPVAPNVVWVCRTLSCELRGARENQRHMEQRFGCKAGQTSRDGKFTLKTAEWLAACGQAPMVQINDDFHEYLTIASLDRILDELSAKTAAAPSAGPHDPQRASHH